MSPIIPVLSRLSLKGIDPIEGSLKTKALIEKALKAAAA